MMTLALQSSFAQTRAPGEIRASAVKGSVSIKNKDGSIATIKNDQTLPQGAVISTTKGSSVVIGFSNGASLNLGGESELVIDEYLQESYDTSKPISAKAEPSTSTTKLQLNKGELVGSVKKLNYAKGSTFTVNTPVGAAGIRGTIFRLIFTVDSKGKGHYSLVTLEGVVVFTSPKIKVPKSVEAGKEVEFEVDIDEATGEIKSMPTVIDAKDASSQDLAEITEAFQDTKTDKDSGETVIVLEKFKPGQLDTPPTTPGDGEE